MDLIRGTTQRKLEKVRDVWFIAYKGERGLTQQQTTTFTQVKHTMKAS